MAEGAIHDRLVPVTSKNQTKEMSQLFTALNKQLVEYATKRPKKFDLNKMVAEAEEQWKSIIELKKERAEAHSQKRGARAGKTPPREAYGGS